MARPPKFSDEEILDTARRCFLSGGPAVPTSAIAAELGVSEAALFKRFGTKEELMMQACMPPAIPGFLVHLEEGPETDADIGAQISGIAHHILDFMQMLMPRIAVLKAAGISPLKVLSRFDVPPPVLGQRAISAWLARAVAQGQLAEHDCDAVAYMLMGSLHGRTMLGLVAGGAIPAFDREAYVAQVVRVLLDGVALRETA